MDEPFLRLLKAEIKNKERELERFKKALAMLEEEPKPIGRPPAEKKRVRAKKSRIGEERLDKIRAAIITLAQQRDEFRQIDVRSMLDLNSSVVATAFEQLRQEPESFIRFARKDGNNKYYRLTPEALRTSDNGQQE